MQLLQGLNHSSFLSLLAGVVAISFAGRLFRALATNRKLRHIPTVGPSSILSSYSGAMRYLTDARGMLQEGYEKYHGNIFKVPMMTRWTVIICGSDRVDELRRASDDMVSFRESFNESLQLQYTLGPEIAFDPYHIAVIRTSLTRNIGVRFHDIQDEIAAAFVDHMPATEGWSKIQVLPTIMQITCRTINRFFVGLPICRNPDYRKLNIDFTTQLAKNANIIGLFPEFLRPIFARCFTDVSRSINQGLKDLGPMIQKRLDMDEKYGMDWDGRPNDLISWLLETAKGPQREPRDLALRVLAINFSSIHTTSMTFTQILFDLAKYPKYIPALREEIEAVVRTEGVTKASLLKMVKLDSFIKESQRIGGIAALSMGRKLLQDFRFSDGVVVPKGTHVAVANMAMHGDKAYYTDPTTFDGYRFVKMSEKTDDFNKHSMVTLGTDYIIFGSGRHACPGRFLAVSEIKAFMVHLLMNYDMMLDPKAPPFKNLWFISIAIPEPSASILIRQRKATT